MSGPHNPDPTGNRINMSLWMAKTSAASTGDNQASTPTTPQHWVELLALDPQGAGGYSDMQELSNGQLLLVYEPSDVPTSTNAALPS